MSLLPYTETLPGDGLGDEPEEAPYEPVIEQCGRCLDGKVVCGYCRGKGYTETLHSGGRAQWTCDECVDGWRDCGRCDGAGEVEGGL